jgi:hypothetical protein
MVNMHPGHLPSLERLLAVLQLESLAGEGPALGSGAQLGHHWLVLGIVTPLHWGGIKQSLFKRHLPIYHCLKSPERW